MEAQLRKAIDGKAKPTGSLGRIEDLAVHVGLVRGTVTPKLGKAALVVFAGDHGLVDEGVTAYPQNVSSLVAGMILEGVAGANIAATASGAAVVLVDAGLKSPPIVPAERQAAVFLNRSIRCGTSNSLLEPAMSASEVQRALTAGAQIAAQLFSDGYGVMALGEIGIGNSSAASLLGHALAGMPFELAGPGAGEPRRGLDHKRDILRQAFSRAPIRNGFDGLREFGGFEMAMLAGAAVGAAAAGAIVLVDGFIATASVWAAIDIQPNLRDYLIYTHLSPEPGHAFLLKALGANPLFDLGLRLGEGTGAALAIPFVSMAERLLTTLADLP